MTQDNSTQTTTRVDDIDRHVSSKLRARRMILGLSQQSLADEVNVSVQQVQKYERANNRISSGKLYHFSRFLNVPIEYFYSDIEHQIKPHIFAETKPDSTIDSTSERDVLLLIRSYNNISDVTVRKKILELVKSVSAE